MPNEGLICVASRRSVVQTMDSLVARLEANGLTVFARIDHGANAAQVGMALRPTQVVIFGNPRAGTTVLMQENQASGLDLPFRALVWEDADGQVWLTYNDPQWLAHRYAFGAASAPVIQAMRTGMEQTASSAVS
jgi:uncharacterized protein (DUF302 family)